jgi:hypothetical protein
VLEEITLDMVAADPTDCVLNREQLFDGLRVIPVAMGKHCSGECQLRFACNGCFDDYAEIWMRRSLP